MSLRNHPNCKNSQNVRNFLNDVNTRNRKNGTKNLMNGRTNLMNGMMNRTICRMICYKNYRNENDCSNDANCGVNCRLRRLCP